MTKKINYIAPINNLGYGVVGTNILVEMVKSGINVSTWPIGTIECSRDIRKTIINSIAFRSKYDTNATSLRIWHQNDLAQHVGNGKRIGFPIFELDKFNAVEIDEMARMDKLFVCSEWAKKIVENHIPNQDTSVVPLGVDRNIFNEEDNCPDENWTTFINIGKWEYRKGHDIIPLAFEKAFNSNDRVRLWMMNENPFISDEQTKQWQNLYKNSRMGHKINFLPRVQTHEEVASIMKDADCGVFPARAEGWNLELLEMMSMGKSVITTDYSAHTEFCNTTNSLLISFREKELAKDGFFFDGECGGEWMELGVQEVDRLADAMETVHNWKKNGTLEINNPGIETAKRFSWKNTVEKIKEEI